MFDLNDDNDLEFVLSFLIKFSAQSKLILDESPGRNLLLLQGITYTVSCILKTFLIIHQLEVYYLKRIIFQDQIDSDLNPF